MESKCGIEWDGMGVDEEDEEEEEELERGLNCQSCGLFVDNVLPVTTTEGSFEYLRAELGG